MEELIGDGDSFVFNAFLYLEPMQRFENTVRILLCHFTLINVSVCLSVCMYLSLYLSVCVCVLQELHHEMQTKQTSYYCALHVGRTLKDQCPPTDPERNVLSEMMQLLKTRWRDVWPAISQRYKHTDTQTDRQTDKHVNSGVSECVGS